MRLAEVFRFEFGYRMSRATTWIYFAILFGLAFSFIPAGIGPGGQVHMNAPERLAEWAAIAGLFGMLVSAALFADAALRDVESGMDALVFTSPIARVDYLGGRYLAALAVNVIVVVAIPIALALSTVLYSTPESFGPFRMMAYLQPYVLLLLPNTVLVGAILFTIAVRTRQTVAVYLGAIGLFIAYLAAASSRRHIDDRTLAALVDPFAMATISDLTRYWTTVERNTELVGFPSLLMWNRLAWLAVAGGVLLLLYRGFRFAHADGARSQRQEWNAAVVMTPERAGATTVPRVAGRFGVRTAVSQALAVARHSLEEIAGSPVFAAALLVATGLMMLFGWNVVETLFDNSTWPVTHLIATIVTKERMLPIIFILIAVFAGELVWKDREVNVADIADASPVSGSAALAGRFLALVVILALFQIAFLVGGILIQALQGYHRFEIGVYLEILGLTLIDYALLAALAMTVHIIVNQKYLGHLVVLMVMFSTVVPHLLGLRHHLLIYGTGPGWTYSDMNGFGPFIGPLLWFKLYWAAWALLLAVVANLFLVRGRESSWRRRLGLSRARFAGPAMRVAGVAVALILVLGGFIFYNTNVLNAYRAADESGLPQAEYERKYARFATSPQPTIEAADLRMEIYSDKPGVDIRGSYRLVNRTGVAIDSVHLYMPSGFSVRSVSFDRGGKPVLVDAETGYRIHGLERALAPGDSLRLQFDVAFEPRGFTNDGVATDVASHTARFDRRWLPVIGYQRALELQDESARERLGLAARPPMPGPDDAEAKQYRNAARDADLVQVNAVIGTSADQIAITPGVLKRVWMENGRRYFRYETDSPGSFGVNVYSGRYTIVEDRWKDVTLRIYHHPAHDFVIDNVRRSMKASLAYFTEQFGPYPDKSLSIVEFPRYGGYGIAHPHTIGFSENYFVGRVKEGELDMPFYGTAHEIAHQWWGGMLRGAMVRGHGFLSESLANYSAMILMADVFGPDAARRVYDFQMDRYLNGRAEQSREVPALLVEDQPYIAYRKGAIALYTMREYIGETAVNGALRRYVQKYRDAGPPYPTSYDLYAELRAVTPDSVQYLLKDLFEEVTLWDVKTERARIDTLGNGTYRVTLDLFARKTRADSVGSETETPMNDLVDIGVFGAGNAKGLGAPLYLRKHRIRSGRQTMSIVVGGEPARAGIDPYNKLIDRRRDDNLLGVGSSPAGPTFSARGTQARYAAR